jgi:predicted ATP-grasp superfamily ATP-dependent carboligase
MVEPVVDQEIESICDGFLRGLGYVGLCEIEMKRDARDGRPTLIEVNPRMSGTGDCASYMGVEVGWLHYLDMIGRPPRPVSPIRLGFRHVTLRREAVAVPTHLRFGALTWAGLLRSYRSPLEFYDLDLRDFRVSIGHLVRAARAMVGTIRRPEPRPEVL